MGATKEDIMTEIRKRHASGSPLYPHYIRKNDPDFHREAIRHFGSWQKAVLAAELDYLKIKRYRNWSHECILQEIRRLKESGEDLSFRSLILGPHAPLVYAAIRPRRFGSWRNALVAAGLDVEGIYRYRSWNDDTIIREILRLHQQGVDLSSKKMDTSHNSLISTARRRFGSWSAALARAGLDYDSIRRRRRWSKDKIVQEIRSLHARGESLSSRNIRMNHPSLYSAACKTHFFGSWTAAIAASKVSFFPGRPPMDSSVNGLLA